MAGAAIVALTGIIAREIGGRAWAIACAGSLCALFNLAVGNFFSMNSFEPLFWMGAVYLLVRIINGGSPTFWLWLGVVTIANQHFYGRGAGVGRTREVGVALGVAVAVGVGVGVGEPDCAQYLPPVLK